MHSFEPGATTREAGRAAGFAPSFARLFMRDRMNYGFFVIVLPDMTMAFRPVDGASSLSGGPATASARSAATIRRA